MPEHDPALVYLDAARDPAAPGTHVFIIGVGHYRFGKGTHAGPLTADLNQLTSPPVSARAVADWFIRSFRNGTRPLASVSLLLSENPSSKYDPPRPAGAMGVAVPESSLQNVENAARLWAQRIGSNRENLAVFYFCGHGVSNGTQAALLLSDFASPGQEYKGAIDLQSLQGTLRNSPAIQQVLLIDCCRTHADDIYENETTIGSRIVSILATLRGHQTPVQQCLLFPSLDGEHAFGLPGRISAFTSSILDAVAFAAGDYSTGLWTTTTAAILDHVDRLIRHRIPASQLQRSKPNALSLSSFIFNEIPDPVPTRSVVTVSDLTLWGTVELHVTDTAGRRPEVTAHSRTALPETCCTLDLNEGRWRFAGALPHPHPTVQSVERDVRSPVAYVRLEVAP